MNVGGEGSRKPVPPLFIGRLYIFPPRVFLAQQSNF